MSRLGSLTTTFIPAPSCLSDIWQWNNTRGSSLFGPGGLIYNAAYLSLGPPDTSDCYPSSYQFSSTAYYSPGICPSGYAPACVTSTSIGSLTETTATCCPSGYTCQSGSSWLWYSTEACASGTSIADSMSVTSTLTDGSPTIIYVTGGQGINAYGVIIRWQSSDRVSTTMPGAAISTSVPARTTSPPTSTSIATGTAFASSSKSPGLSIGAKIGIGVGAGLGGILLVAGIALFTYRLGKRRRQGGYDANVVTHVDKIQPATQGLGHPSPSNWQTLQSQRYPHEMYGQYLPREELS